MQVIQSNPQNDPRYYVGQMLNNLVSEILEGQEKQRRAQELRSIGQWASGGFAGEMPNIRTQFGQSLTANLLDALYQPITPYQQMASERLKRYKQIRQDKGQEAADKILFPSSSKNMTLDEQLKYWQTLQNAAAGQYYAPGLEGGATEPKNKKVYDLATRKINEILEQMKAEGIEPESELNNSNNQNEENKMERTAIDIGEPVLNQKTPASDRIARSIQGAVNTGTETAMKMGAQASQMKNQKSPYPDYPDAFMEDGVWKVMRDGKKYRIEE